MTYTNLIERLGDSSARHDKESDRLCIDAANAIEALQAENERNEQSAKHFHDLFHFTATERDQLQSRLDAMGKSGAVASIYISAMGRELDDWKCELPEGRNLLYAAPKALEPEPLTDERQPLSKVLAAVREYMPPDGISAKDCLSKIIAIVDPWPLQAKPLIALKDEEISLMAHNEDEGEWNDLRHRDCWHEGYKAGARATEAAHAIGGTP